jgi:hypothetical protein
MFAINTGTSAIALALALGLPRSLLRPASPTCSTRPAADVPA